MVRLLVTIATSILRLKIAHVLHIGRLLSVHISAVVITDRNRIVISVSFANLLKRKL
jgi:hypothetical protein